ncbi:hypothetical protein GGX14DRAFT_404050 [Mycena pura]|uniref:Uncharacterized protein n=1 Tax=Mycena pura TaxID=153505 RepID=A0AAD6UYL3_9AGAR|nr:hypothetical protein GGX14DRAFT_404050 [Mycena pura]
MADVIEVDTDVPFNPSKWIGTRKIYKDVPKEVSDACIAARKIPSCVAVKFPALTLPVSEFLDLKLPSIFHGTKKYHTKGWFSTDLPNCDTVTLAQLVVVWSIQHFN